MGCSSSTNVSSPGAAGFKGDDNNFVMEADWKRTQFDKKTGQVVDAQDPRERPEGDLFEAVDAGAGEQFMATKPWKGAIKEPSSHNPPNPSPPDVRYDLEYVYGYRCEDSRQNLYFNQNGEAVYMTAALGVILNKDTNT